MSKSVSSKNDIAGKNLTTKVPIFHLNQTSQAIRQKIIRNISKYDTINYVYIVDKYHRLKGAISIKNLFTAPLDVLVKKIIDTKLVTCRFYTDQEKVARLAVRNNIKAIPVVSKHNKFLGVVPSDKILQILNYEHSQDFYHLSGIIPSTSLIKNSLDISILKSFLARLPWIIVGIFGGLLAAKIISLFSSVFDKQVALATFIPLIVYISAAIGSQTQTIYIRDIAISSNISILAYGLKQLITTSMVGLVCSLLIASVIVIGWGSFTLAFVVSLSVFITVIFATIISITIPSFLRLLKFDPAIGSGPFATIIQDILSVLVYMTIALQFYK